MNKKKSRMLRSRQTRIRIAKKMAHRLSVYRSNKHISVQLYSKCGTKVLASASTMEREVKSIINNTGSNCFAAREIGKLIADRVLKIGIQSIAFDRSGFLYHGRVKALADAARETGLKF